MDAPVIGVLATYLSGPYYGALVSAVTRAASEHGARVAAVQTAGPGHKYHESIAQELVGRVAWARVAGLVTIANCVPVSYLEEFRQVTAKPVVAIGNQEEGFSCPVVLTDNRGGVKEAVEHLLAHGHTRIAFAGCLEQFDIRERYESYLGTLREHGVAPCPQLFFDTGNHVEGGGRAAAKAMLAAGMPATAVLAATDRNAIGLLTELKDRGVVLPRKLAIVGFDDMPGCALQSPSLASVGQNFDRLGTKAVEVIMALVRGEAMMGARFVLPASLIARESCGCVPSKGPSRVARGSSPQRPVSTFLHALGLREADHAATGPVPRRLADRPAPDVAPSGRLARLTDELVGTFKCAEGLDPSPLQLLRLGQVAGELYALCPTQGTIDAILVLADELSLSPSGAERPPVAAERLRECFVEVRIGLTKAVFGERNQAYYRLLKAMRDEYEITLDLLAHDADPSTLGWLARTGARFGLLATWRGVMAGAKKGESRGPGLEVVGSFQAPGQVLELASTGYDAELFPPAELFDAAGPECLVSIFPVRSAGTDWGFLAIADSMASGFVSQDFVFMWSAIFSEALDHRALLRSLNDRSEDLARSYEREKEMAQAVRESEERYALAARAANDGLWDWDLARGTVYFSTRWKEMLGYAGSEIGDQPSEWFDRVHPDDRSALEAEISALQAGECSSLMNEHRVRAGDGSYKWTLCRGLAVPGEDAPATRLVGSLTDVTERHQLEERLRHQALYDSLTGLPNPVLLMDRLAQAVANAKRRPGYSYTVLWLDLDNFKSLNDSLGHQFGDKLLVQVAERIRAQLREMDTAARFGGDEFVLLLLDVPDVAALQCVVARLLEALCLPYRLDEHEVVVTGSLGVATGTSGYDLAEDVLRDADIAMYQAKSTARGSYAIFDGSMHAPAMDRQAVEGSVHPQRSSIAT